jgi:hypothetical protein
MAKVSEVSVLGDPTQSRSYAIERACINRSDRQRLTGVVRFQYPGIYFLGAGAENCAISPNFRNLKIWDRHARH